MGDFKSKLPNFQELSRWTGKLFHAVKQSMTEIVGEYKQKRSEETIAADNAVKEQPLPNKVSPKTKPVPPTVAPVEEEPASTENNTNKEPINKE